MEVVSFIKLSQEYSQQAKVIGSYVKNNKNNNGPNVQGVYLPIARSMIRDLTETSKILKLKALYEYGGFTKQEIARSNLTNNEKKVLDLRLKNPKLSFEKIDNILEYSTKGSHSYAIYQRGINKVEKMLSNAPFEVFFNDLSDSEKIIYYYLDEGFSKGKIAELSGIPKGTIKSAHNRIKKKCDKHELPYPGGCKNTE